MHEKRRKICTKICKKMREISIGFIVTGRELTQILLTSYDHILFKIFEQ